MLKKFFQEKLVEAGCDEAGRGCLAGPVFAAAVILPKNFNNEMITDSKLLSAKKRIELRKVIEKHSESWAVAMLGAEVIDEINILQSSIRAMHLAISKLSKKPEFLIIDGNKFLKYENIPYECLIKGDRNYLSIASASILAKTYRDEFMENLHQQFPHYQWNKNKGYPTLAHREAIRKFGITTYHRKTFRLLNDSELF